MSTPYAYAAAERLAPGVELSLCNTAAREHKPLLTTVVALRDNPAESADLRQAVATALLVCAGDPGDDVYVIVNLAHRGAPYPLTDHAVLHEQWALTLDEALTFYRD